MAIAPKQPTIIACIITKLLWKNSQFFTKVQRSGIAFLLQPLLCQVFPTFKKELLEFLVK